jgi:hypothetical protein
MPDETRNTNGYIATLPLYLLPGVYVLVLHLLGSGIP